MRKNSGGFSFVEIIIVIAIITVLGFGVAKISMDSKQKTDNAKISADISSLEIVMNGYFQEKNEFPLPDGTINFFKKNGSYIHDDKSFKEEETFGAYGVIPKIEKKYLDEENTKDPRTNNFYSYGITKDKQNFQVAGVLVNGDDYKAKVSGNFGGETGVDGLIKSYNSNDFVVDGGADLPYNPEKVLLTASDKNKNFFVEKDILEIKNNEIFKNGEKIFTANGEDFYDLYFSDGSIARIDLRKNENIKIKFGDENNSFDFVKGSNKKSKINLFLETGSMWMFAGKKNYDEDDELKVRFEDYTAAVRGTVFEVSNSANKYVKVYKGEVEISKNENKINISETNTSGDLDGLKLNFENSEVPYINGNYQKEEKKQNNFRAYFFEKGKVRVEENKVLNSLEAENFYGFQDGKYYNLKMVDGQVKTGKEGKGIGDNYVGFKFENDGEEQNKDFLNSKIFEKSCFELTNETSPEVYNICEESYADIFEGYNFKVEASGDEIKLSNPDNYILEFEMSGEELLKFWNSDNDVLFENENLRRCIRTNCDLLKIENGNIFIHNNNCDLNIGIKEGFSSFYSSDECNNIKPIEKQDLQIKTNKNYKIIYKVETKQKEFRTYNLHIIDLEKNEIIFRDRIFANYIRNNNRNFNLNIKFKNINPKIYTK